MKKMEIGPPINISTPTHFQKWWAAFADFEIRGSRSQICIAMLKFARTIIFPSRCKRFRSSWDSDVIFCIGLFCSTGLGALSQFDIANDRAESGDSEAIIPLMKRGLRVRRKSRGGQSREISIEDMSAKFLLRAWLGQANAQGKIRQKL